MDEGPLDSATLRDFDEAAREAMFLLDRIALRLHTSGMLLETAPARELDVARQALFNVQQEISRMRARGGESPELTTTAISPPTPAELKLSRSGQSPPGSIEEFRSVAGR